MYVTQMYVTPEQIQATTKANVEAMLSLATSQFAAIEKFASLNANAVKAAFEDSIDRKSVCRERV